jgi:hypothetical protein
MKKSRIISLVLPLVFALVTVVFALVTVSEGAIILDAAPNIVVANGISQVNISAQLLGGRYNNVPLAYKTITFLTIDGVILKPKVKTDSNGWAYTSLISSTTPGEVTITAKYGKQSASTNVMFIECGAECNVSYPPKGIYSLLRGSEIPLESLLSNQYVKGISIRASWDSIESGEGTFDWSYIDNLVSQAKTANKTISITIMPGVYTPEWVYAKGAEKFYFIDRNQYHPTYGQELYCPMPWDEIYLTSWKNFIEALAYRYAGNPVVSWIRITGPMNTVSGDWNLQAKEDWDKYIGTENEFSDEKLITSINKVTDWFTAAFPSKPLSIAIAKTKITDSPPFLMAATAVTNYGFANYPNQFFIQMNGWKATILLDDPELELFRIYAPHTGAQMVWSATDDPYCRMNGGYYLPCDPYTSLAGAVESAKDYNLNFLEIYAEDIVNPYLQSVLEIF